MTSTSGLRFILLLSPFSIGLFPTYLSLLLLFLLLRSKRKP